MAVHVPLSKKAIEEAKELMLPENNLLKPADGVPIAIPNRKEMALGIFYITQMDNRIEYTENVYGDPDEAVRAYQSGHLQLRQRVNVYINKEIIETSVGRILFNDILPDNYSFINKAVTSSVISDIFTEGFEKLDKEQLVKMIDAIKDLGFYGGTISGLSFGTPDAVIHPEIEKMLAEAEDKITEVESNFALGLITADEKRRLAQEVWIDITEELAD